jgi:hypothetical protein
MNTTIISILVGLAVLLLGRKLFWLFVGGAGFVAGMMLATRYLDTQPEWLILVIAVGAGLVGIVLALFIQRVAVFLAGFIAGGYIALQVLDILSFEIGQLSWIAFIVGAIIGGILVSVLFDWALIFLSSLTGAAVIAQATDLRPTFMALLFIGLFTVGVVVQAGLLQQDRLSPRRSAETSRRD